MIITGDTLTELKRLPAESVHCCVTSPPYWGLRDYGVPGQMGLEKTPAEYLARMTAVFEEVRRVLRGDGTLWLNMGDSYASNACGYNAEGSMGASHNLRISKKTMGAVVKNRSRTPATGLKAKDLIGMPWRLAFALQAAGWYLRSDIIWHKPNPMPESVRDRPTKSHEYIFLMSKNSHYYYDENAVREAVLCPEDNQPGDWARANNRKRSEAPGSRQDKIRVPPGWDTRKGPHTSKTGRYSFKRDRDETPGQKPQSRPDRDDIAYTGSRNKRDVWTVATCSYDGAHFATFPPRLIEPCILAGCPPGGVVLDPFGGSGTTGEVAAKLGRRFILIELNPAYVGLQRKRLGLFGAGLV